MNRTFVIFVLLVISILRLAQDSVASRPLVLDRVTIIDPTSPAPRRDMTILIIGNRIAAVDKVGRIRIPANATVIDANGRFVIPGLADMHNHLGSGFSMPGLTSPADGRENPRGILAQMLGWGFTTVFSTSHPAYDLRDFTNLRSAASDDTAPLPRFFGVGRAISAKAGHASQPRFASYLPDTIAEARQAVREMKAAGVDAIKLIYSDQAHTGRPPLPTMQPDIMRAIIDETHNVGLRAYVHAPTLRHAKEVLRAGADGLVHSVADAPVDDEFIALMKKNGASYTTTLSLYTAFSDIAAWMRKLEAIDERKVIPKEIYERYESPDGAKNYHEFFGLMSKQNLDFARGNARRVFQAGLLLVTGTDTGVTGVLHGAASQMELVLLTEAGLTPTEAIRAATLNPAMMLNLERDLGTIEPGKLADLVVLDGDPQADILNIRKIFRVAKGGVLYDPAELLAN